MTFPEIVSTLSGWVWGAPFIFLCMATGLYFSWRTRFLQVRYFKQMWQILLQGKSSSSGISSFQSFNLALAGRIGTGKIAGVATAIALGGPGAIFWMWAIAFFGAATGYIETALAQVYKEKIDGNYRGGPAYYILKGIRNKSFAFAFAFVTIISLGLLLPGVQSNTICDAFQHSFGIDIRISAAFIVIMLALIIYGGVRRIARISEIVMPIMTIGYVVGVAVILIMNFQQIPAVFTLIIKSAFGLEQSFAGMIGAAISMGVKRGIFANEAGQGTAAHAAAACEVPHPAKQGLVQALSIYIDTMVVCSATAFVILITGTYRVYDSMQQVVFTGHGMPEAIMDYGPINTQLAIDTTIPGLGSGFVAIALFCFAFTTIMSYYFQAESNVYFLFRKQKTASSMIHLLRICILLVTFFTSINAMSLAWDLADIGVGLMAWLNLIALIMLRKISLKVFSDFDTQYRSGIKDPIFRPDRLGIANTESWTKSVD
ncbi:MAG: alanine:cation symporter family protein [Tannerella sp.]|nr:alanine:cation symporter family protein [Tannerella sp.]